MTSSRVSKLPLSLSIALAALLPFASSAARAQASDAMAASGSTAMSMSGHAARPTKAERAANRALQKKVRVALTQTSGLNLSNVSVRARNGAVTLEGTVPEQRQIDMATQAAQQVDGVKSVRTALSIRPLGQ